MSVLNLRVIANALAALVAAVGAVMLVQVGYSMCRAMTTAVLWIPGTTALAVGAALFFLTRSRRNGYVSRQNIFLMVVVCWLGVVLVGAAPFLLHGAMGPVDAFFNSMAGFTTTGAATVNPEGLSPALLLWRSLGQWIGGLGIIVLFVAIAPQAGFGATQLYTAEAATPVQERITPRIRDTVKVLAFVYGGLMEFLASRWLSLTPGVRRCAAREIVSMKGNVDGFVAAIADGRIPPWTLTEEEQQALIAGAKSDSRRQRAAAVFSSRAERSVDLQARYRAAVDARGNARAGRAIYDNLCVNCHSDRRSPSINLGPPLAHLRGLNPGRLVIEIAVPSHTIHPDYESYVIERKSGPVEVVMLAGQTDTALRFRRQNRQIFEVQRENIIRASVVAQSAMPAGLAELLDAVQMADLVTFIVTPER